MSASKEFSYRRLEAIDQRDSGDIYNVTEEVRSKDGCQEAVRIRRREALSDRCHRRDDAVTDPDIRMTKHRRDLLRYRK